jgi:hypothetical protein
VVQDEYGAITLTRATGGYRDFARRYQVFLDGAHVGMIGRGQSLRFKVPTGQHQLQLKIAWCSSQPITAEVKAGEVVSFSCAPGDDEPLEAITAGAQRYIDLRQVPDKSVVLSTALPPKARLRLAFALVGFASGPTCLGALLWRGQGDAPHAADALVAASVVGFLASRLVMRLTRPR